MNTNQYTDQEVDFLKNNYPKYGPAFCSLHLKRTQSNIQWKAVCLGIKYISKNPRTIKPNNKFKVNADHFINVTTPEHAYLLGFIWADGSICPKDKTKDRITIEIVKRDYESIKHIIEKTGDWNVRYHKYKNVNHQETARICTNNKPLRNFLKEMDYGSKSASPDKILKRIPEHLKHYWFLGIFDGDGSIIIMEDKRTIKSLHIRTSIASAYDQDWSYMEKLFNTLNVKYYIERRINKTGKNSTIKTNGLTNCYNFLCYLYQKSDNIKLQRKYEKFIRIKETLINNQKTTLGVYKMKRGFRTLIIHQNKKIVLGLFDTEKKAALAYNKYVIDNKLNRAINTIQD